MSTGVAVVQLASEPTTGRRWRVAVHAGGGWDGHNTYEAFGVRANHGPVGVVGRVGADGVPYAELGVRLEADRSLAPHLELAANTAGRQFARAGLRLVLEPDLWLELAGGAARHASDIAPTARVELVHPLR